MLARISTRIYFVILSFFLCFSGLAQGDLMIMPKRLVFDGSQRAQEINLINTGKDTAVYAISFVQYRMTQDGKFEQIDTPDDGQNFADDFLRYYPRRVSLGPNEAQTVRVQLTRTGNLENGEYRSHLYFRAIEEQTALGSENVEESDGISINIKTVFGISIPVIIRNGTSTTQVEISDVELGDNEDETYALELKIKRSGNMSVYGNLVIEHVTEKGKTSEIQKIKGISVYTPNSSRNFVVQFPKTNKKLDTGKLRITYTTETDEILAVSELNLE